MCSYISSDMVLPGWVCCADRIYNGLQRHHCRVCGRQRHSISIPPDLARCVCGFGLDRELVPVTGRPCPSCARDGNKGIVLLPELRS